jgi:hypothetical protein
MVKNCYRFKKVNWSDTHLEKTAPGLNTDVTFIKLWENSA